MKASNWATPAPNCVPPEYTPCEEHSIPSMTLFPKVHYLNLRMKTIFKPNLSKISGLSSSKEFKNKKWFPGWRRLKRQDYERNVWFWTEWAFAPKAVVGNEADDWELAGEKVWMPMTRLWRLYVATSVCEVMGHRAGSLQMLQENERSLYSTCNFSMNLRLPQNLKN